MPRQVHVGGDGEKEAAVVGCGAWVRIFWLSDKSAMKGYLKYLRVSCFFTSVPPMINCYDLNSFIFLNFQIVDHNIKQLVIIDT